MGMHPGPLVVGHVLGGGLMSQHEIEDLLEESIRLLDRIEGLDHRSMFKRLYDLEASPCFDIAFTHFRVMDILLKRRFYYRMALEDHPDYAQFKDALEGIRKEDFSPIARDPSAEDDSDNPVVACWSKGQLYCEAGSELWTKLSELGRLSGADREAPQPIDFVDIADTVVSFAVAEGNKELTAGWYAALPILLLFESPPEQSALGPDDAALQRIRDAVVKSEAYKIKGDGCLAYPARDEDWGDLEPDGVRFLQWWYEPLWGASGAKVQ